MRRERAVAIRQADQSLERRRVQSAGRDVRLTGRKREILNLEWGLVTMSDLVDTPFERLEPFPIPPCDQRRSRTTATVPTVEMLLHERRLDASGQLPTRTASTCGTYAQTVRDLVRQADPPLDLETAERLSWTIEWAAAQDGSWRANTIQVYWAALLWAVERLARSGVLDLSDVHRLLDALERRPALRPAVADPRTSARKRKSVHLAELRTLIVALGRPRSETKQILFGLLLYGPGLGLRPIEFRWATVQGDRLLVRCAKNTNGRAVAETRTIELLRFDARALRGLVDFLGDFQKAAAAASSWTAFTERLTRALHRLCRTSGIDPISLYTLRHQAIANAKVHLSRKELAAFAGHASQRTARRGYPSAGSGWGTPLACGPDPASIAAVRPLPARRQRPEVADIESVDFPEADAVEAPPLLEEIDVALPAVDTSDLAPVAEAEPEDPSPFRM